MTLRSSILDHPSSTSPSACPPFSAGRYDRLEAVDAFAQAWARNHARQTVDTDRLVGFCLLIRREVIDRIGLLDERFGIGNFEDDDFCRRALHAGYRSVIAVDAFLHHFGGRTFLASGIDFAALMTENRQKFEEKWNDNAPFSEGATGRVAPHNPSANDVPAHPRGPILFESVPVRGSPDSNSRFQITFSPTGGLLLRPNPVKLSLCMIVRDNETTIGPALESIRPWVDEIIVVDTGSTDKTPEICLRYGAQLFEFPWCDDFSAARNESLKHARGEWIFWMDSDDTISVDCGSKLRQLAGGPHDDAVLGYIMQVHCPGFAEEGGHDVTVVDHVKLIRNRPDLRFDGRIHEQLLPAIRQAQGEVAWTDIYVVHSGSDHAPAGWQRKLERDLRILHKELDERPDHPFVLFNLGMTYADDRRYQRAVDYLQRCLEVSRPDESHQRKAYALLASSLGQAGRHDEAWAACQQGLALYPEDKELLFRSAMLHHHFGRLTAGVRRTLRFLSG